jgi:hypothetical protein
MREPPLILPRRLAISLLHEAQIAQPDSIRGVVTQRGRGPCGWRRAGDALAADEQPWAALWSCPQAAAVPDAGELVEGQLSLVVSLNTKGVLEMRAWRLEKGAVQEQVLKIRD